MDFAGWRLVEWRFFICPFRSIWRSAHANCRFWEAALGMPGDCPDCSTGRDETERGRAIRSGGWSMSRAGRSATRFPARSTVVLAAIGRALADPAATFTRIVGARRSVDPLARIEPMPMPYEEAYDPPLARGHSHEAAKASLAPRATGVAVEALVRVGVVRTSRPFARAADTLINAFREKRPGAP